VQVPPVEDMLIESVGGVFENQQNDEGTDKGGNTIIETVELQSTKRAASVGGTPPELAGAAQKKPQVSLRYTCGS